MRTPEQAGDAAAWTIGVAVRSPHRWPRGWPAEEPQAADNTTAGDHRAWLAALADDCAHTWARSRDPERYGRQFRWQQR